MLGSLARKLRLLGFDTVYVKDAADSELKYMVRSQGRILLTRDIRLAKSLGDLAWPVKDGNVREEFISIAGMLADTALHPAPFSRCLDCNGLLQSIEPTDAQGIVPPYIYQAKKIFSRCSSCGKIFWEGTHRKRMEEEVAWMREKIVGA